MSVFEIKTNKTGLQKVAGVTILKGKFTKTVSYKLIRNN